MQKDAVQRREIIDTLTGNLRRGIGEVGTDTVLLRSFSALDLSILAALELQDPVLDAAGYRRLLDDALAYLAAERDLRGIDSRVGWIHATAHAADAATIPSPRISLARRRKKRRMPTGMALSSVS